MPVKTLVKTVVVVGATVALMTAIQASAASRHHVRHRYAQAMAVMSGPEVVVGPTRPFGPVTVCQRTTCVPSPSSIVDETDISCPMGERAIGGGYQPGAGNDVVLRGSYPVAENVWHLIVQFTLNGQSRGSWTPNVTCS